MKKSILAVAFILTLGLGTTLSAQEVPATSEQPATEQTSKPAEETIEDINVSSLPQAIVDGVARDFAGATIKEAKINKSTNIYVLLLVKADTATETVSYNESGELQK